MRCILVFFVFGVVACGGLDVIPDKCSVHPQPVPEWQSLVKSCSDKMRNQVNTEMEAALTYMAMGAHFSRDTINRPGFAKMFFASASEEREHAFKIIEYLLMREDIDGYVGNLINSQLKPKAVTWESPLAAMKAALELEVAVTKSIRDIVVECEDAKGADLALAEKTLKEAKKNGKVGLKEAEAEVDRLRKEADNELFNNDYHLVDYLTGEFLEEQLKGQRELAGRIHTLGKMVADKGELAEFLFDKKLLNGEAL